jgi:hypothetical protein
VSAPGHCQLIGRWRIVEADMDKVSGTGSAELLDDGSIEIEFAYHNGRSGLKAKRDTSSTAC